MDAQINRVNIQVVTGYEVITGNCFPGVGGIAGNIPRCQRRGTFPQLMRNNDRRRQLLFVLLYSKQYNAIAVAVAVSVVIVVVVVAVAVAIVVVATATATVATARELQLHLQQLRMNEQVHCEFLKVATTSAQATSTVFFDKKVAGIRASTSHSTVHCSLVLRRLASVLWSDAGTTYFTQPPMRRMRICFTYVFFVFFLFFPRFFPSATKYQTTVLGNG